MKSNSREVNCEKASRCRLKIVEWTALRCVEANLTAHYASHSSDPALVTCTRGNTC